jgi:peptidylprolyl isomerase
MTKATRGDKVRVHYTGRLTDGTVFDSSENAGDEVFRNFRGQGVAFAPLELVIGEGELPPQVEEALVGLEPGQGATVHIPCAEGFGPHHRERVMVLSHDEIMPREAGLETFRVAEGKQRPNNFNPKVGDVLEVSGPDGALVPARVVALTDSTITLDANHPLAGRDLVFEVRLVGIA